MADIVGFHSQLASIMEVLANTAVAEICKLVDDGYAVLRWEMSQSQKENEELRRRLRMMEMKMKMARGAAERARGPCSPGSNKAETDEVVLEAPLIRKEMRKENLEGKGRSRLPKERGAVQSIVDGNEKQPSVDNQTSPGKSTEELGDDHRSRHGVWESADFERKGVESAQVKEEKLDKEPWSNASPGRMKMAEEGAEEATEISAICDSALPDQNLEMEPRMKHSIWEVSGLQSTFNNQPEDINRSLDFQHREFAQKAEMNSSGSQYERNGRLKTFFTQVVADMEKDNPPYLYAPEAGSDSLSQDVGRLQQAAGHCVSTLDSEVVLIDSAAVKTEEGLRCAYQYDP